jgi:hypothetical protein
MKGFIRLTDALEQMDQLDNTGKPVKFQMKYVTHDKKRKTGGEIIEIIDGRKCVGKRKGKVVFDTRKKAEEPKKTRNPHHWTKSTRNVILPNGQIRKFHIRLIIEFNHEKVCF